MADMRHRVKEGAAILIAYHFRRYMKRKLAQQKAKKKAAGSKKLKKVVA